MSRHALEAHAGGATRFDPPRHCDEVTGRQQVLALEAVFDARGWAGRGGGYGLCAKAAAVIRLWQNEGSVVKGFRTRALSRRRGATSYRLLRNSTRLRLSSSRSRSARAWFRMWLRDVRGKRHRGPHDGVDVLLDAMEGTDSERWPKTSRLTIAREIDRSHPHVDPASPSFSFLYEDPGLAHTAVSTDVQQL